MSKEDTLEMLIAAMSDGDEPDVFALLKEEGMSDDNLLALAHRVHAGRAVYGALRIKDDKRNYREEARQEYLDMRFYSAAGDIRDGAK